MVIGMISKGEAAQGKEAEGQIDRKTKKQGCVREACVCVTRWNGGTGSKGEREPS